MSQVYEDVINWADLKTAYIKAINGEKVCKRQANQSHVERLAGSWKRGESFYGPNAASMIEWLHKGYKPEGMNLDPPITPIRKRRRLVYGDEGELQLDLMWSGHDYPFLQWTQREIRPGMRVSLWTNFQAGTNVRVIQEYYRFVLRSLIALESSGIDLEIWVTSDSVDMWTGEYGSALISNVQVKKEGEQTDYLGWSAMISPGGYRHLKFLDYILASDKLGKTATYGLGRARNMSKPWDVKFDPQERVLEFHCPWHPSSFPEGEMEMRLREVLKQSASRSAA